MKSYYAERGSRSIIYLEQDEKESDLWHINSVSVPVPARRQGIATRLMQEVCRAADEEGVRLMLVVGADSSNGPDQEKLYRWYCTFGFQADRLARYLLTRMPMITPRVARSRPSAREARAETPLVAGRERGSDPGTRPTR